MKCLYCGGRIGLLGRLQSAQFCSEEHQRLFTEQHEKAALERLNKRPGRAERIQTLNLDAGVPVRPSEPPVADFQPEPPRHQEPPEIVVRHDALPPERPLFPPKFPHDQSKTQPPAELVRQPESNRMAGLVTLGLNVEPAGTSEAPTPESAGTSQAEPLPVSRPELPSRRLSEPGRPPRFVESEIPLTVEARGGLAEPRERPSLKVFRRVPPPPLVAVAGELPSFDRIPSQRLTPNLRKPDAQSGDWRVRAAADYLAMVSQVRLTRLDISLERIGRAWQPATSLTPIAPGDPLAGAPTAPQGSEPLAAVQSESDAKGVGVRLPQGPAAALAGSLSAASASLFALAAPEIRDCPPTPILHTEVFAEPSEFGIFVPSPEAPGLTGPRALAALASGLPTAMIEPRDAVGQSPAVHDSEAAEPLESDLANPRPGWLLGSLDLAAAHGQMVAPERAVAAAGPLDWSPGAALLPAGPASSEVQPVSCGYLRPEQGERRAPRFEAGAMPADLAAGARFPLAEPGVRDLPAGHGLEWNPLPPADGEVRALEAKDIHRPRSDAFALFAQSGWLRLQGQRRASGPDSSDADTAPPDNHAQPAGVGLDGLRLPLLAAPLAGAKPEPAVSGPAVPAEQLLDLAGPLPIGPAVDITLPGEEMVEPLPSGLEMVKSPLRVAELRQPAPPDRDQPIPLRFQLRNTATMIPVSAHGISGRTM